SPVRDRIERKRADVDAIVRLWRTRGRPKCRTGSGRDRDRGDDQQEAASQPSAGPRYFLRRNNPPLPQSPRKCLALKGDWPSIVQASAEGKRELRCSEPVAGSVRRYPSPTRLPLFADYE